LQNDNKKVSKALLNYALKHGHALAGDYMFQFGLVTSEVTGSSICWDQDDE